MTYPALLVDPRLPVVSIGHHLLANICLQTFHALVVHLRKDICADLVHMVLVEPGEERHTETLFKLSAALVEVRDVRLTESTDGIAWRILQDRNHEIRLQ